MPGLPESPCSVQSAGCYFSHSPSLDFSHDSPSAAVQQWTAGMHSQHPDPQQAANAPYAGQMLTRRLSSQQLDALCQYQFSFIQQQWVQQQWVQETMASLQALNQSTMAEQQQLQQELLAYPPNMAGMDTAAAAAHMAASWSSHRPQSQLLNATVQAGFGDFEPPAASAVSMAPPPSSHPHVPASYPALGNGAVGYPEPRSFPERDPSGAYYASTTAPPAPGHATNGNVTYPYDHPYGAALVSTAEANALPAAALAAEDQHDLVEVKDEFSPFPAHSDPPLLSPKQEPSPSPVSPRRTSISSGISRPQRPLQPFNGRGHRPVILTPTTLATPPSRITKPQSPKGNGIPHRRGALSAREAEEAAYTRDMNACIRCHMQKTKCTINPDHPRGCCLTCAGLKKPTMSNLPCLRWKISESQLIDKGTMPRQTWTTRWKTMAIADIDAGGWASSDVKIITLTQDIFNAKYELRVREFLFNNETDAPGRSWNSPNGVRYHPCTPYAIADMRESGRVINQFVDDNIENFINYYTDASDQLMRNVYNMAYYQSKHALRLEERELLRSILRLWVASRMESKQENICGNEVLGMTRQLSDSSAKNYNKYLVPPVMEAQIEIITTALILIPEKENVLRRLESLVKANKRENWFTIYLAFFILLHNTALLTQAEQTRAKREGRGNARYYNDILVQEFHSGARTMLAYFHYLNKGACPFNLDWNKPQNKRFADLNDQQIHFMRETARLIKIREEHFANIKRNNNFEDSYYFVSQLYEPCWSP